MMLGRVSIPPCSFFYQDYFACIWHLIFQINFRNFFFVYCHEEMPFKNTLLACTISPSLANDSVPSLPLPNFLIFLCPLTHPHCTALHPPSQDVKGKIPSS